MSSLPAPAVVSNTTRQYPRSFLISAWSVPVLVVGQFALVAIIPVLLILFRSLRDPRLRDVRPWAIALSTVYASPLISWMLRANRAPSLSKDMNPAFVVLIVIAAALVLIRTRTRKS